MRLGRLDVFLKTNLANRGQGIAPQTGSREFMVRIRVPRLPARGSGGPVKSTVGRPKGQAFRGSVIFPITSVQGGDP
jgi:hypothetical protein